MIRNALMQAPRVSVDRTAEDMLRLFAGYVRRADETEAVYAQGRRLVRDAIEQLAISPDHADQLLTKLNGHPASFALKYREGKARDTILHTSRPGLDGFVESIHYMRPLRTIATWSIGFHGENHGGRGDIIAHLEMLLRDLP